MKTVHVRRAFRVAALFAGFAVLHSHADTMHIEDVLERLPTGVALAVVSGDKDLADCRIVGRPFRSSSVHAGEGYFATTADGCLWGAHAAPLWVVWRQADAYRASQVGGGYALETLPTIHNGRTDVRVRNGSAAYESTRQWYFDGYQYRELKKGF